MQLLSRFRDFVLTNKEGWSLSLPLLIILCLPFYMIGGVTEELKGPVTSRIIHIQFFQLMTVLAFCLCYQKGSGSGYLTPFRWFTVLALSQLLWVKLDTYFLFQLQMIIIAYVFFEVCVRSRIKATAFLKVVIALLIATAFFAMDQYAGLFPWLPDYISVDRTLIGKTLVVHGIWCVQAFCGAFCALSLPLLFILKTRVKWLLIIIATVLIGYTDSSFAIMGAIIGISWVLILSRGLKMLWLIAPALALGTLFCIYFDLGDMSSVVQRWQLWKMTMADALKQPIWGHSLGSFYKFGLTHSLMLIEPKGQFFAQAHNEWLQVFHELGIVGASVYLWLVLRVMYLGLTFRNDPALLGISGSILAVLAVSLGQPIFHVVNISAIVIVMYAILESEQNKTRRDYVY